MPRMFGNLSIRPKLIGLLAVPVAGATLLGVVGAAAGWDERGRAEEARRMAAVAGVAAERLDRLALVRAEVDRRLATSD
jgi:hypothetical protein